MSAKQPLSRISIVLRTGLVAGLSVVCLALLSSTSASATLLTRTPDAVLGQADFDTAGCNRGHVGGAPAPGIMAAGADSLCAPGQLTVDLFGHFWLTDSGNNRVLAWPSAQAFATHAPAMLVIGQTDFSGRACNAGGISARSLCHPFGIAADNLGHLYVADTGNNRVLRYNLVVSPDRTADLVIGQNDFSSFGGCSVGAISARSLCRPLGLAVDILGRVLVADSSNNRVLRFESSSTSADLVLGQPDFTTFTPGRCDLAPASDKDLCQPAGIAVDQLEPVYVADQRHSRVLGYRDLFLQSGQAASLVVGHPNFTATGVDGCAPGQVNASSLCFPFGVTVDGSHNLFVADTANSRVLRYAPPAANGPAADLVLGQPDFNTRLCNIDGVQARALCRPEGVLAQPDTLIVADSDNSRVLRYGGVPALTRR